MYKKKSKDIRGEKGGKGGRRRGKKEIKGNGNRNGWGMGREGKVGKKCTGRIGYR